MLGIEQMIIKELTKRATECDAGGSDQILNTTAIKTVLTSIETTHRTASASHPCPYPNIKIWRAQNH